MFNVSKMYNKMVADDVKGYSGKVLVKRLKEVNSISQEPVFNIKMLPSRSS